MSDSPSKPDSAGPDDGSDNESPAVPRVNKVVFTKAPQPELSLADRQRKAGWTKNRIAIWVMLAAFAIFMIGEGLVGILTKSR